MSHNIIEMAVEHESHARTEHTIGNVTHVTQPHITFITGAKRVTLLSERRVCAGSLPQKMVEPASWGVQPFYPDVDPAPPFLELRPQELGHVMEQVERPAVPEVQPWVHAGSLA